MATVPIVSIIIVTRQTDLYNTMPTPFLMLIITRKIVATMIFSHKLFVSFYVHCRYNRHRQMIEYIFFHDQLNSSKMACRYFQIDSDRQRCTFPRILEKNQSKKWTEKTTA